MTESWKSEKFRKSVEDKINDTLKRYNLGRKNYGLEIETAIFEKVQTKQQYLGYVAKMILEIRRMICVQENWLENQLQVVLNKPPLRLRRVLPASELAKYNLEMMKLKNQK